MARRETRVRTRRQVLVLLAGLALVGCAPRQVPTTTPQQYVSTPSARIRAVGAQPLAFSPDGTLLAVAR